MITANTTYFQVINVHMEIPESTKKKIGFDIEIGTFHRKEKIGSQTVFSERNPINEYRSQKQYKSLDRLINRLK